MRVIRRWPLVLLAVGVLAVVSVPSRRLDSADKAPHADPAGDYPTTVVPLLKRYCLDCHSTKVKKSDLDLERFATTADLRKDLKPWTGVIEQLEAHEMPPKGKPQPTADERKQLVAWVRTFLDAEARSRAGDPGHVPLRRLSNAEYDATVRDLTGVDLRPAREFPADGAAGEGFTNAAEGLAEMSPTLLNKYLTAAKGLTDHAVLLPDGFRFSTGKTRRDWTDESLAELRKLFASYTGDDGRLPLRPYLLATVRHREPLNAGRVEEVAAKEKLHPKYLRLLWETLNDKTPSFPIDRLRTRWRTATEKDVDALMGEVGAWQAALWRFVPVGSYRYHATVKQLPNDPKASGSQALELDINPPPGQMDVVLYLSATELPAAGMDTHVVWKRPRFQGGDDSYLLKDYATYGSRYEIDYPAAFSGTPKYLAAAVEAADTKANTEALAAKRGLDPAFLKRWIDVLALDAAREDSRPGREVPAVKLELLDDKIDGPNPWIRGWKKKGTDLPSLVGNRSNDEQHIPGTVPPHKVACHPTPTEFVAAVWTSPVAGQVRIAARVKHAHAACGNGVAWWLEHRRGDRAGVLSEGVIGVGGLAEPPARTMTVAKGDVVLLAVDARDGSHVCDLTEIGLTITEAEKPNRTWDLAADVADTTADGNPHADRHGTKDVWTFVRGPSRPVKKGGPAIPPDSVLGMWRSAALDPARKADADKLADQVKALLIGPRPTPEKSPDRLLYDALVSVESPLFQGVDVAKLPNARKVAYGLAKDRFDADGNLTAPAGTPVEVRVPAALFRDHLFVVEGAVAGNADRVVQLQVRTTPTADVRWDGKSPLVGKADGAAFKELRRGFDDFRRVFPQFVCFPRILPDDEVVCLKMYHREDEPLSRLFLTDEQAKRLDRLWVEHRFISRQPVAENDYLPQFIGYVTQDQPKELLAYFEGQRPTFKARADEFLKEEEAAIPKQLDALLRFADRAYRRPLTASERGQLLGLYDGLRKKGGSHEEAFRGVLTRVFVAPSFLFHVERAPPGKEARPVSDHELASRLSYFLWSSMPDDQLRRVAAEGKLRDPAVLARQVERMLNDPRVRNLAIEFGTQWIHVRGFEDLKEKNESLFPTFDANLRQAMSEESIRFFQDLFRSNRPVTAILDADYTFLNETLAKHYGIPGVTGPEWRQVTGVRKYGRGGILGLGSVQTRQAGASRTSPVLRGNWVVETLLGEKLPKPPPNVPQLPESETGTNLTMRQLTERHTKEESCAACHVRIDPLGFAFEKYDPIGRYREKDAGGLPVDAKAKLRDGTEFEGIDGLRDYLLTKKKDVIVRLFCKRLLGYALGRAVTLSDTVLTDEMVAELNKHDGRVQAAVQAIVRSPQFRMIRGSEAGE